MHISTYIYVYVYVYTEASLITIRRSSEYRLGRSGDFPRCDITTANNVYLYIYRYMYTFILKRQTYMGKQLPRDVDGGSDRAFTENNPCEKSI